MQREPFHERCRCLIVLLAMLGVFGVGGEAHAQMKWEERAVELHPSFSDTKAVAEFHFTNTGKKPVRITDADPSCGCTVASFDKKHLYAPGEKGTLTAVFEIGGRNEPQTETIDVKTTDSTEPELVLQLKVMIPKLLDINNVFISWKPGEELKPKTVAIKALGDYPVSHIAVSSSSPDVDAEIKHEERSRDYELVITPKKAAGQFAIIEIKPDYPKDPPKLYHVYASVGR